jgi:hypothetical protein
MKFKIIHRAGTQARRDLKNLRGSMSLWLFISLMLASVLLSACATETPAPTTDVNLVTTMVAATMTALQPTAVPSTETPLPSPTAIRTPPGLPVYFLTSDLNPFDAPHTYFKDICQYLKAKWDPNNAAPGTVVMVIMFHSITDGEVTYYDQISTGEFSALMNDLHDQNFTAINMQQFADFMYKNAKIPQRSVLLIVDDRKSRVYFDTHFKSYYDAWGWPVVNAWINLDDSIGAQVLPENIDLEKEGWVDHQSHGYIHNTPMSNDSSDDYLTGELKHSMELMQQNFGKTPLAIIWPGGGFGVRPVQFARQFGYQLGFTINPRGPVMFNWIPQADVVDNMRPSYMPEGPNGGDPLMTLPRYWSTDARRHIDTVRVIGKEAAAYAEQNKATELEYYNIVCAPTYGALPNP